MKLFFHRYLLLLPADGAVLLAVVSSANVNAAVSLEVLFLSPPTTTSHRGFQRVSCDAAFLCPQLHKNGCLLHHLSLRWRWVSLPTLCFFKCSDRNIQRYTSYIKMCIN